MGIWERFDNLATDVEVQEALEKQKEFAPLPAGDYYCTLEELLASESKSGLPMLKGKFRTLENRVIFYNQMLQNLSYPEMTAVNIAEAVSFLSGLSGKELKFTTVGALEQVIESIPINAENIIKVNVSYGAKDIEQKFTKIKILEINATPPNDFMAIPDGVDSDLPFN